MAHTESQIDVATEDFFAAEADLVEAIKADAATGHGVGKEWQQRKDAFGRMLAAYNAGGGYRD